jgi:hypothetical protein
VIGDKYKEIRKNSIRALLTFSKKSTLHQFIVKNGVSKLPMDFSEKATSRFMEKLYGVKSNNFEEKR